MYVCMHVYVCVFWVVAGGTVYKIPPVPGYVYVSQNKSTIMHKIFGTLGKISEILKPQLNKKIIKKI